MAGVTVSVNKYRILGKEIYREGRIVLVFQNKGRPGTFGGRFACEYCC
jgi:hypothetical protein